MNHNPEIPDPAIFEIDSSATQSMHALMIAAQELDLLTYICPVDLHDTAVQVPSAVKLIWPDTDMTDADDVADKTARFPEQDKPADQRGQYYLIVLETDEDEDLPIFLPEGHVVHQVFMLAAKAGKSQALRVLYRRGLLPTA